METLELTIDGMTCGHCVTAVRSALSGVNGVEVEDVTIGAARVRFDPGVVEPNQIVEAVEEEGYQAYSAA